MEKIQRRISLEKYKIRYSPSSGETSEWGNIANDYDIATGDTLYEINDKLPLIEKKNESGETICGILRYGTMISIYSWLNDFIKGSKIYKICLRGNELKNVLIDEEIVLSAYTTTDVIFSKYLPSNSKTYAIKYGGVWSEYDENGDRVESGDEGAKECYKTETNGASLCSPDSKDIVGRIVWVGEEYEQFLSYFSIFTDYEHTSKAINRANAFLNFTERNKGSKKGEETPYAEIPIYIEDDITDMGLFTSDVDVWAQNKKYYLGDRTQDGEGTVWRLVKTDKQIERMQVPTHLVDFINAQLNIGTTYKKYTSSASDLYDISGVTSPNIYIDGSYPNFTYVRSYYCGKSINDGHWEECTEKNGESAEDNVTGITESKLLSLRRKKKSYDDDSNELPFIVNESGETEIIYSTGIPMNVIVVDNTEYYDYIESITTDSGLITFTYHIGASNTNKSGVTYQESYPFIPDAKYTCMYEKVSATFTYTAITYECQIKDSGMELSPKKLYAKYTISKEFINSDDFQKVVYIKDENLMGIQKINKEININIERGNSAARERHQVLGEVSSFDDLISYKNGFFTLKSD